MRPWAKWLIKHRMAWLLKAIVIATYPLHVAAYYDDAWLSVKATLKHIDWEVKHD